MATLTIDGLEKVFPGTDGPVTALEDIGMSVGEGELAVVVGPSGCGKSTLLNIVAGLEAATAGTVRVGGRDVAGPGADRGMVFQSYTLFPWLSVVDNVAFGLRLRGIPPGERRETARAYVERVGLAEFENAYPAALSGGMKQRVAIARVLANNPAMLLMDEPFGALDAQTRLMLQELLLRIWSQDRSTVLFITHDIDEAILLADRIFIMSRRPGRIVETWPVAIPRPRDHHVTVSPEFLEIKRAIMDRLWREMEEGG